MTPFLYEVHTRQWLAELGVRSLADVPDAAVAALAALGVTHLWAMGVWAIGPRARHKALTNANVREEYAAALPDWTEDDVAGSPYAIADYRVAKDLGGDAALAAFRTRLHRHHIALVLDFVPNHIGIDHPWVQTEHVIASPSPFPDAFADGNRFVAHGKDPYFPGWTDTAQVDYRRAATRRAMRDTLRSIADRCDGVRCDMAMLVLPDIFERTWQHVRSRDRAAEFWADAIAHVEQAHPRFLFIAEAYWNLEDRLCELGFDYAYDKVLYDHLRHGTDAASHARDAAHARRVHFLENHDETRAATAFTPLALHRAAALLTLALPGMRLLHHGQLDGARRFARIQLRRRAAEPVDAEVHAMYDALLRALRASSVGQGTAHVLSPSAPTFAVIKWPHDLVVVNLAPQRAQCRVVVPGAPGPWRLVDRLGPERWDRSRMDGEGLFLDLPAHGAQLFALERG